MTSSGTRRSRRSTAALALALAAALTGCSGGKKASPRPPASATLVGTPKALFVASAASDPVQRLHEVDLDDAIRRIEFRDSDGNPVPVGIWSFEVLSKDWVLLHCWWDDGDPGLHVQALLLRMTDGKVFDVSRLFPVDVQLKGGSIYSVYDYIARLDLSTMLVHPMSNPQVDHPSKPFLVDDAGNVRAPTQVGTSGAMQAKIFFADNSPPLVDPWQGPLCVEGGGGGTLAEVYGENGKLYAFCAADLPDPDGSTTARVLEYFVREVSFTPSGTQVVDQAPIRTSRCTGPTPDTVVCPDVRVGPWPRLQPHTRARQLTFATGFFGMSAVPAGGISLQWTDLPLPDFTVASGGYVFWRAGDGLYRLRLQAGASPETIVTDGALISWEVAGGVVVFTKYLSGTEVGTYRVTGPGMSPALLSTSEMHISQIGEL
jgi:hypothetical protein